MRRSLCVLFAALLASVGLFASACGTESVDAARTESGPEQDLEQDAVQDREEADAQQPDDAEEPSGDADRSVAADSAESAGSKTLADYVGNRARGQGGRGGAGRGGGAGGGDIESQQAEQAQVEVEIQRCMRAQGFEYVPDQITGGLGQFLAQVNQGLSAEEFAETRGFGISTRFDEVLDGDVVLEEDEADPNDEHLATLSDGEADAWQFALRGAPPERNEQGQLINPETGEAIPRGQRGATGGCQLEANTIVRGDRSVIDGLADEFEALEARIDADPRVAEISREWAACMRDAGFTYETEGEARAEINQEFRPLIRAAFGRGQGAQGAQGGGQGRVDLSSIELTPEQDAELQQLQDREIAIARASLTCEGDTAAEIAEIRARYEAEFVEANREVLESIGGS